MSSTLCEVQESVEEGMHCIMPDVEKLHLSHDSLQANVAFRWADRRIRWTSVHWCCRGQQYQQRSGHKGYRIPWWLRGMFLLKHICLLFVYACSIASSVFLEQVVHIVAIPWTTRGRVGVLFTLPLKYCGIIYNVLVSGVIFDVMQKLRVCCL